MGLGVLLGANSVGVGLGSGVRVAVGVGVTVSEAVAVGVGVSGKGDGARAVGDGGTAWATPPLAAQPELTIRSAKARQSNPLTGFPART